MGEIDARIDVLKARVRELEIEIEDIKDKVGVSPLPACTCESCFQKRRKFH